ncbi:hypothetical protein LEUCIP111803_00992 [Leucobacter soli]|uniref:Putative zinc-finger domain-containing protein n=3 Tax=Leucobacter soli TaxID=2812850 RepID=A0A916JVQ5_9MICO|nr:hypothetical protein LEUCIP111803_00992 [Leucobacter soli]
MAAARGLAPSLDPDDLVSAAYLKIFELVIDGRGPRGAFRPYLYQVIRTIAADQFRSRERPSDELDQIPDLHEAGPWEDNAFDLNAVAEAFAGLDERWQAVLWYTEVEGLAPREAARLIGLSPNATSALAVRAKDALRSAWVGAHVNRELSAAECRTTLDHLQRFQRGKLTARAARNVEAHLGDCSNCAAAAAESATLNRRLGLILAGLFLGGSGTAALFSRLGLEAGAAAGAGAGTASGAGSAGGGGTTAGSGAMTAGAGIGTGAAAGGVATAAVLTGTVAAAAAVAGVIALVVSNLVAPDPAIGSPAAAADERLVASDEPIDDLDIETAMLRTHRTATDPEPAADSEDDPDDDEGAAGHRERRDDNGTDDDDDDNDNNGDNGDNGDGGEDDGDDDSNGGPSEPEPPVDEADPSLTPGYVCSFAGESSILLGEANEYGLIRLRATAPNGAPVELFHPLYDPALEGVEPGNVFSDGVFADPYGNSFDFGFFTGTDPVPSPGWWGFSPDLLPQWAIEFPGLAVGDTFIEIRLVTPDGRQSPWTGIDPDSACGGTTG